MSKEFVICDLDGTIAIDTGRAKECLHSGKRDWDAYFARCHEDIPNEDLIRVLQNLWASYSIVILTGRIEKTREVTKVWLAKFNVPYSALIMRDDGNHEDDQILKPRLAKELELTPKNVLCIFEDRQRVVDAWREAGFSCFQVAKGDF